jgi:hypothetical protein
MTQPSTTAVSFNKGEITIDAEVLAPKLGLSTEALKVNMAKGLVTNIAETGVDEDAGRRRLTFRYRSRIWCVVIDADGALTEVPSPTAKPLRINDPFSLLDLERDEP